jgi:glycosyltransferase involved in cell wall biosynthesis
VEWLKEQEKPDAVHLSNALLLGLAPQLKAGLNCSVICTLQDEDTWIDAMPAHEGEACWQAMAQAGESVDAFVSVSQWYADKIKDKMHIPDEKLKVIHLGVDNDASQPGTLPFDPPVIGYLSRLAPAQGLDRLVDAFIALKQRPEFFNLRLKATGGITAAYRSYIKKLQKKLKRNNMLDHVEFLEDFGKEERRRFLRSITLMSVPAPDGEAFGAFMLEALANGVPVVQPEAGACPEVVQESGGGITYNQETPGAYEEALASLLSDPGKATALGEAGRQSVLNRFNIKVMARQLAALYQECQDNSIDSK